MSRITIFLKAAEINCCKSKKSKTVPLQDLDVKGSCVWNPYLPSFFDNFLTLTSDSNQRDIQTSSSNSSTGGREKPNIFRGVFRTLSNIYDEAFHKNCYWVKVVKITHRWGTPQNFFLAFTDELEK